MIRGEIIAHPAGEKILLVSDLEYGRASAEATVDRVVSTTAMREEIRERVAALGFTDVRELVGRSDLLRQVLVNLLSNAAKFTENGKVSLTVRGYEQAGEGWLDFVVEDTGWSLEERHIDIFVLAKAHYMKVHRLIGAGG